MNSVMVVDEDSQERQLVAGWVKALGFEAREAEDAAEALNRMEDEPANIALCDVSVATPNGLWLASEIRERHPGTAIIMASPLRDVDLAVSSLRNEVVDYLLKPFDRERFQAALTRVKQHFRTRDADELRVRVRELLDRIGGGASDRLVIRDAGRVFFLGLNEIDWIEAAGNYVRVHAGKQAHLVRHTISGMLNKLPASEFLRVSRSSIVNLKHVREVQPLFNGCFVFILQNGERVESSRRFRRQIADTLAEGA